MDSSLPTPTRTLLVSGVSGFLGSEVARVAIASGWRVVGISRTRPSYHGDGFQWHAIDLRNTDFDRGLLSGIDAVVHCAGLAHQFDSTGDDAADFDAINATATQRLAAAAAEAGVARFVLVSSVSVYGPGEGVRDEAAPCHPDSPYGVSKLQGERLAAQALSGHAATELIVLRLSTLFGKGDPGNVARLIQKIARRRFLPIGRGANRKSLLHVEDAARACVAAAEQSAPLGPLVYNVVGFTPTIHELIDAITSEMGHRRRRLWLPTVTVQAPLAAASKCLPRSGRLQRMRSTLGKWLRDDAYDGSRFREAFRMLPTHDLTSGLRGPIAPRFPECNAKSPLSPIGTKRLFDIALASIALSIAAPPIAAIALAVRLTSKGPVIYVSRRFGRGNRLFEMPKFRTMRVDAPELPTHLLMNAEAWTTPLGRLLRSTSLDELPQLWSIFKGDMSFVGPRPALHNQDDLIQLRTASGASDLAPGLTGWAQVNGRDELSVAQKAAYDADYVRRRSLRFDLWIIALTLVKVWRREGVRQAVDALPNRGRAA